MEFFNTLIQVFDSTIRLSVPLLLACLAGLYSERSGIFDIGLEGKMLAGAFAAGAAAAVAGSAWAGLAMGVLISVGLALVHGFASITHRGNQIVSGVAINFIAAGSTIILGQAWFHQGGRTPSLTSDGRFNSISLPFADALSDVPVIGQIYSELISGHSLLVYFAFFMVPFTWWVLFRTRFGLRLRAVGENPAAVDTAGISVAWLRYRAVICTGILCGFAGAYLALAMNAGFVKDMTAGRGFIALAALIFAKWRPVPAMMACLLFGFLDATAIRLGGTRLPAEPLAEFVMIVAALVFAGFLSWGTKWSDAVVVLAAAGLAFVAGLLVSLLGSGEPVGPALLALRLIPLAFFAGASLVFLRAGRKMTNALGWGAIIGLAAILLTQYLTSLPPQSVRVPVQLFQALPYVLTVVLLAGFIGKAIPPRAGGQPYVKER